MNLLLVIPFTFVLSGLMGQSPVKLPIVFLATMALKNGTNQLSRVRLSSEYA